MPNPVDYTELSIIPDPDTRAWWEATREGRFLVRTCLACGNTFFPPLPACRTCGALDVEGLLGWQEVTRGVIHSYIVVVQPVLPHLVNAAPYVVATVELPEVTQIDGTVTRVPALLLNEEDEVAIGLPVEPVFEATHQEGINAPRWRISGTAANTWKFPG